MNAINKDISDKSMDYLRSSHDHNHDNYVIGHKDLPFGENLVVDPLRK